jgi:hypothetical protein
MKTSSGLKVGYLSTYSSFTNSPFSESVEVLEELFESDSVLKNLSLESDFYVQLNVNHLVWVSQKLCIVVAVLNLYSMNKFICIVGMEWGPSGPKSNADLQLTTFWNGT